MRRSPHLLLALLLAVAGGCPALRAELVWSAATGWQVKGGALGAAVGEGDAGSSALELMNKARAAEEAGRRSAAFKLYQRVAKKFPNSIYAAEAYYRSGLVREQRGQLFKAFDSYQQMLVRYPNNENFNTVVGAEYGIAAQLAEGKRSRIFYGLLPGFKNRDKAIQYFEQIVANAPYSDYAPLALMNAARGYQRSGSTDAALDALDRMINAYPRNVLTPDAYLKLGQTHSSLVEGPYYDQASTKQAITYFEDYLIQFPGDAGAADAEKGLAAMKKVLANSKMILADYYYRYRKNYKAARVFYNEAITTFPDSEVAERARTMLADVDARLGIKPGGDATAEGGESATPADAAGAGAKPAVEPVKKKKRFILF